VIRTLRLDLTSVTEEDFECVRQLRTDVKVREYLGGPATDEKIRAAFSVMMESGALPRWIVRSRPDCRFIGLVALGHHCDGCDVEVSYELLPDSWGKRLRDRGCQGRPGARPNRTRSTTSDRRNADCKRALASPARTSRNVTGKNRREIRSGAGYLYHDLIARKRGARSGYPGVQALVKGVVSEPVTPKVNW